MKKIFLIAFVCVLCSPFCRAAEGKDTANSLLWKISSKDMKRPSFLFGTIHLICPDDFFWTAKMQKSLESTQEICFEMDMDDPQLLMQVAEGMSNTGDHDLKQYFTDEQYGKLQQFLRDNFHMDISMFRQMKPAALQTVLIVKLVNCPLPMNYETEIMEKASKLGKDITGIEEPSEQISLLNNLPVDSVVLDLMEMIDSNAANKIDYTKLVSAYKNQDLTALYDAVQAFKEKGNDMAPFLDERNNRWIPRMVEKMDQHSVFFAVGAGHLPGDQGVISLLRQAGYTVEPVK